MGCLALGWSGAAIAIKDPPKKTTKTTTSKATPPKTTKAPTKAPTKVPTKAPPAPNGKIGTAVKAVAKDTPSAFAEGMSAFKAGDYAKAEEAFRRAAKTSPQDPIVYYFLGRTLKRRADCVGALSAFSAARAADAEGTLPKESITAEEVECQVLLTDIPIAPQASIATEARVAFEDAQVAYATKSYDKALAALEKVVETRPQDAAARYYLGLTLSALDRQQEALRAFLAAKRLDPQLRFAPPEDFRQALAKAQVRLNKNPKGASLFQDSFLDRALVELQSAPSIIPVESYIAGRRPILLQAPDDKEPSEVAQALWQMELRYQPNVFFAVANSSEVAIKAQDLSEEEVQRLREVAQRVSSPTEKLAALQGAANELYERRDFTDALALYGALTVAALALFFVVARWRRQVENRRARYTAVRDAITQLTPEVAEVLANARLSISSVPNDDLETLIEDAERLFFFAREKEQSLPKAKGRKLPQWAAEEALFALEEAGRKGRRVKAFLPPASHLGCFFCARPILVVEGGYRTRVSFQGSSNEVLTCRTCARAIAAGDPPPVKMVVRKGRRRHWSQTRAFSPRYDYYIPRIQIEMLPAVEAWNELFGDDVIEVQRPIGRPLLTTEEIPALSLYKTIPPDK